MTEEQAEFLLENYPELWSLMQHRHERIMHSYRASGSFTCRSGTGSYSDKTASKAIKLMELDKSNVLVNNISEWLNDGLETHYRGLLIERWRGYAWQSIARRRGVKVWQVMDQWKSLIQSLMKYQIAFVGHANG